MKYPKCIIFHQWVIGKECWPEDLELWYKVKSIPVVDDFRMCTRCGRHEHPGYGGWYAPRSQNPYNLYYLENPDLGCALVQIPPLQIHYMREHVERQSRNAKLF